MLWNKRCARALEPRVSCITAIGAASICRFVIPSGPWCSLEAVQYATLEWVDWFNNRRLLEPIGNIPPAELEASYDHSTGQLPMAA